MEYEYIHFVEVERKPKTSVFELRNSRSGDRLGVVKWYPAWRQYCYFPDRTQILSAGCLADIQDFIGWADGQRGL